MNLAASPVSAHSSGTSVSVQYTFSDIMTGVAMIQCFISTGLKGPYAQLLSQTSDFYSDALERMGLDDCTGFCEGLTMMALSWSGR